MPLLMLFALIAGAGTAITPCVLPVLPALLSASAVGGRRRPLGIVTGLAATFTIAIVALAQLVKGVGLASGAARTVAIIVLLGFGVVLLIPDLAARVQAPLSRLARFGPKTRGDGFWTGVAVGGALGFVCAPCAGPILAAVTSVSAQSGASAQVVAVALSYALGLSAVLLLYATRWPQADRPDQALRPGTRGRALDGRRAAGHRGRDGHQPRRPLRGGAGQGSEPALVPARPHALARNLERGPEAPRVAASGVRVRRSASRRPRSGRCRHAPGVSIAGVKTPSLPVLGAAPEFTDTQKWFNTPGGRPLTLAGLRGHVVLVDFWTYTCINCIRTLPFLDGLYATYHRYGLEIVGVETPEFTFEQDAGNVQQAIASDGLRYPVVQDNRYGTWNAYQNQYWPAEYLIDANGQVRHTQFGEGNYKQDEAAVRELLYEAGVAPAAAADDRARGRPLGAARHPRDVPQHRPGPRVRGAAQVRRHLVSGRLQPAAQRVRAVRELEGQLSSRRRRCRPAPRSRGTSRPPASTW